MKRSITLVIDFELDVDDDSESQAIKDAMVDFYTDQASLTAYDSPVTDFNVTATIN